MEESLSPMDRARRFAAYVGVPLRESDATIYRPNRYSWTGKCLLVTKGRHAYEIEHDICHYLEAEPRRRWVPEFGLGRAPWPDVENEWGDMFADEDMASHERDRCEIATCLLHIYLVHALRGPWRRLAEYYQFHPRPHRTWEQFWADDDDALERHVIEASGALDAVRCFIRRERRRR